MGFSKHMNSWTLLKTRATTKHPPKKAQAEENPWPFAEDDDEVEVGVGNPQGFREHGSDLDPKCPTNK